MSPTVRVNKETFNRLREAKAQLAAESYDELILQLLRRSTRFGSHPKMKAFVQGRTGHRD